MANRKGHFFFLSKSGEGQRFLFSSIGSLLTIWTLEHLVLSLFSIFFHFFSLLFLLCFSLFLFSFKIVLRSKWEVRITTSTHAEDPHPNKIIQNRKYKYIYYYYYYSVWEINSYLFPLFLYSFTFFLYKDVPRFAISSFLLFFF